MALTTRTILPHVLIVSVISFLLESMHDLSLHQCMRSKEKQNGVGERRTLRFRHDQKKKRALETSIAVKRGRTKAIIVFHAGAKFHLVLTISEADMAWHFIVCPLDQNRTPSR